MLQCYNQALCHDVFINKIWHRKGLRLKAQNDPLFPGPSKVENMYLNFPKPYTPDPDCHGIVPKTTYQSCLHKHAHTSFSWAFAEASCPYCGIRATWRTCAPPLTGRPSSVGVLLRGGSLLKKGFRSKLEPPSKRPERQARGTMPRRAVSQCSCAVKSVSLTHPASQSTANTR